MPQFDPTVWSTQIIWLVITFVALYVLMSRIVLPKISDVLEERDHKINDSLRKADLFKEDAEEAYAAYEKTMVEARSGAQEILRGVREEIAATAAERNAKLGERLSVQTAEAEARIVSQRAEAAKGLADIAAGIAADAVAKLSGAKVTKTAAAKAVAAVREGAGS